MILFLDEREVEVELDSNRDGSRFIAAGYFTDGEMTDLTDDELDQLQDQADSEINAMWTGE